MSVIGLEESEKIAKTLMNKVRNTLVKSKKELRGEIEKIEYILNDKAALTLWKTDTANFTRYERIISQLNEVEKLYLEAGNTRSAEIFKARVQKELQERLTNLKANQIEVEIQLEKLKAQTKVDLINRMNEIQTEGAIRELYLQSRDAGGFLSNIGKAYIGDVITLDTKAAGSKTLGKYMNNLYKTYEKGLKEVYINGIIRGDSYKQMIENLQKTTKVTAGKANILIRTEANAIFNDSVKRVIEKNPLVKGYRFRAVLDSRTSKICQDHDGEFISKDDIKPGINYPPLHPNCRSTVTTVLYSEDEREDTMQRYTKNGSNEWVPVPLGMTYKEFKAEYGKRWK